MGSETQTAATSGPPLIDSGVTLCTPDPSLRHPGALAGESRSQVIASRRFAGPESLAAEVFGPLLARQRVSRRPGLVGLIGARRRPRGHAVGRERI